jgi:hypothetical protein
MSKGRVAQRRSRRRFRRKAANTSIIHRYLSANIVKFAADSGLYRSYSMALFPSSDVTNLFQEYRIKWVELTYQLYNQLNNNSSFPTLFIAPQDWNNNAGTPSSITEVQQFQGIKTFQFGPANPTATYRFTPTVFVGGEKLLHKSPWLSVSADTVQHMTSVEWLQRYNSTSDPTHTIQLSAKICVELRKTR